MSVRILKLISGEEILGELSPGVAGGTVTIKNPVRILVMPTKTDPNTPTVGFAPWAQFSEEKEFTIHRAHIITDMEPLKEFLNQYKSLFGGIVVPTSKLIVP